MKPKRKAKPAFARQVARDVAALGRAHRGAWNRDTVPEEEAATLRAKRTARRELWAEADARQQRRACAGEMQIRTHADGSLDKVAAVNVSVHLEQITQHHWHMDIADPQGRQLRVSLCAVRHTVRGEAELEGIDGDLPRRFVTKAPRPNKPFPRRHE